MAKIISMPNRSASSGRLQGVRDRRYTIRYPFAADAELIELESGKQVDGVTSEFSWGGCFIGARTPWPITARARLRLARTAQLLEALVVVRIVKPQVGLGIEFFDLEPPNNEILASWINALKRTR